MTRRGALLFAAMCVIWGIPYLLIRVAVRDLSPVTLVVGLAGVAAIVGFDIHGTAVLPLVEIAGVATCYAIGPIILARWLHDAPSLGVVTVSIALAALAYLPFAAFSLPSSFPGWKVD